MAGGSLVLQVAGRGGLPASGVAAATLNVTVANPAAAGYLTAWPCDQPRPNASNVNFAGGQDAPNLATVKLSSAGTVCLFSSATTDVIADTSFWYSPAGSVGYVDLAPIRLLDRAPASARRSGDWLHMQRPRCGCS